MTPTGKYPLRALLLVFGALPLKVQYANARLLSWLASDVFRYRRDDVMINLARSFPDKKYKELKKIRKEFYRHFADLVAETLWFGASSAKRLRKQGICRIANPEVIASLYEKCPSVIVMYSHCGNWELYGGIENYNYSDTDTHIREDNFCVVYKKMSSKVWDAVLADNRKAPLKDRKGYQGYVESNDIVRYVFNHKDEKKIYNMNTDQSPYANSKANVLVDFLHQPTLSMTAAAALARKFGMGVAYLSMRPESRGHYVLEYTAITDNASLLSAEEIMKQYYRLLEKDIEAAPHNYLWTHRRWKKEVLI